MKYSIKKLAGGVMLSALFLTAKSQNKQPMT